MYKTMRLMGKKAVAEATALVRLGSKLEIEAGADFHLPWRV